MINLATLHFDTHKVVKLLQEKGFAEDQAIGFMNAMQEITLSGVATQADLNDLRNELKRDIQDLRNKMSSFKADMLKYMMIQFIALVSVMVGLVSFLNI